MKTAAVAILAALAAVAMPTEKYPLMRKGLSARASSAAPNDTEVLQYALTLEHLENTFYTEALEKFSESDFAAAGYPDWVRGRLTQISQHEAEHVALLSGALGADAPAACNYTFGYTDVTSFLSLATIIENVGVSAYAGAAQYISSPAYLTIAAVILSTEARHQAWENSAGLGLQPWSSAYDTALGLDMVYTLVTPFFVSCPASNPALPVMDLGALTVSGMPGDTVQFTFDDPHTVANYAIFYSGLGMEAVQLDENDMAMIPSSLMGIYYVLISTESDPTKVTTSNIVAGPAVLEAPFTAWVSNPAFTGSS